MKTHPTAETPLSRPVDRIDLAAALIELSRFVADGDMPTQAHADQAFGISVYPRDEHVVWDLGAKHGQMVEEWSVDGTRYVRVQIPFGQRGDALPGQFSLVYRFPLVLSVLWSSQ